MISRYFSHSIFSEYTHLRWWAESLNDPKYPNQSNKILVEEHAFFLLLKQSYKSGSISIDGSELFRNVLEGKDWLVGCFGFNGPLRQYFSLYRAVSQREGERGERIDESKNVQTIPTRTYCKRNRPLPYCQIKIVGRPGTGSLPRTIAPPDHPRKGKKMALHYPDCFEKTNLDFWNRF